MPDYSETVTKLRDVYRAYVVTGNEKAGQFLADAALAIETLTQQEVQILKVSGREAYFEGLAADANGRQVEKLAKRNAELHAELERWVSAAEMAGEPKREEVWKDVIGYEGLYQVSDQARVRNNKGKILKQSVKVGKCVYYKYVKLYKDGQYRQGYVHRMMAECFIPNPDNLPIINHKDEDGTNNRLDNLEWCTVEYNSNYGNAKRNMSRGKRRRAKMDGPIITPCRGCSDYDGYGGCKSKGGCARAKMEVQDANE